MKNFNFDNYIKFIKDFLLFLLEFIIFFCVPFAIDVTLFCHFYVFCVALATIFESVSFMSYLMSFLCLFLCGCFIVFYLVGDKVPYIKLHNKKGLIKE